MTKAQKRMLGKIIGWTIYAAVVVLPLLWFAVSWIEIMCNNLTPNYDYWDHNLIVLLYNTFAI